jgi:hypothetical protein
MRVARAAAIQSTAFVTTGQSACTKPTSWVKR